MIAIYKDSQILELEWFPLLNFKDEVTHFTNFDAYRDFPADRKYAFTMHRLHCDLSEDSPAYKGFEEKIIALSSCSDLVFTFESELHSFHWEMWEQCHRDNVYWVVPGAVHDADDMNAHLVFWGDWFKTTTETYKLLPNKLEEVQPYITKPRMFDALLGSPKPHRDHVYNSVQEFGLQDKFIIPYGGAWNDNEFYAKDYFIWEPGVEIVGEMQPGTAGFVMYHGVLASLSRIVPIKVFNDTAYSILTETDHDNSLSFFTEKTAKAFMCRRLFVAFSGYKFLQTLKKIGFKTFDCVIDESYDLIEDDTARYTAAFEQVRKLCDMDQQEVYEKIKPIVEHNRDVIMNTDWTKFAANQIQSLLDTNLAQSS